MPIKFKKSKAKLQIPNFILKIKTHSENKNLFSANILIK